MSWKSLIEAIEAALKRRRQRKAQNKKILLLLSDIKVEQIFQEISELNSTFTEHLEQYHKGKRGRPPKEKAVEELPTINGVPVFGSVKEMEDWVYGSVPEGQ